MGRAAMATDAYYMHMAKQQQEYFEDTDGVWKQETPQRNVRHFRMTKQSKLRHVHVMREKAVEMPERLKVDDTNDPLGGPDAEAIISRPQNVECHCGRCCRTVIIMRKAMRFLLPQ